MDGIHVYGNSRIIIDWEKNSHGINLIYLEAWLNKTKLLSNSFQNIMFSHIYRETNSLADLLSKRALLVVDGFIFFELWSAGSLSSEGSIQTIFS